jgi:thioredoxin reductase (NADPH)
MASDIQVYGTDWCGLTFGVREYLTNSRLAYDYFNVDRDARAHDFVLAMNDGKRRLPMVVVQERVMTNPTVSELQRVLDEHSIRSESPERRRLLSVPTPPARSRRG